MELERFLELMKGEIMAEQHKSIIVKAIKVEDSKIGPRIGICDMEGLWYNANKKSCAETPGAWEVLTQLQKGERLDITYEERAWTSKTTGKSGVSKDIIGFDKVVQSKDEVKPIVSSAPSPQVDVPRPVQQDLMPKMSCLRAAAEIVVALIAAGNVPDNATEEVCLKARALYLDLKEAW